MGEGGRKVSRRRAGLPVLAGIIACLGTGGLGAQEKADAGALASFLVKAKAEGYASGDESRVRTLDDGGREVGLAEGEYAYRDRWYGESRFSGEEIVWRQGKALWSMNFFGAMAADQPIPDDFTKFHKSALRRVAPDAPFRGPARHQEGDLVYVNDWSGSIREFSGVERILWRDQEIYRLVYHGGLLQP
jgi:hypothetical protein